MAKRVSAAVAKAAWWEAPLRFGVRKLLHFTTHVYFSKIEVRGLRNESEQLRALLASLATVVASRRSVSSNRL